MKTTVKAGAFLEFCILMYIVFECIVNRGSNFNFLYILICLLLFNNNLILKNDKINKFFSKGVYVKVICYSGIILLSNIIKSDIVLTTLLCITFGASMSFYYYVYKKMEYQEMMLYSGSQLISLLISCIMFDNFIYSIKGGSVLWIMYFIIGSLFLANVIIPKRSLINLKEYIYIGITTLLLVVYNLVFILDYNTQNSVVLLIAILLPFILKQTKIVYSNDIFNADKTLLEDDYIDVDVKEL